MTQCTYNADNQILTADNGTYHENFTYGATGNRFRVDFTKPSGNVVSSKVYIGNSEFGYNHSGVNLYQRTIIHAPTGACAVFQDSAGVNSIYYVHTDYLGSSLAITNNNTKVAVVDTYSYDAWGRPRTSKTWKLLNIPVTNSLASINNCQPRFDHGYTGHEHLPGFGLINCNARLYDPYSQRFMSPDRDIKDPTNAQNLNRYTYCLNNPFRYTDPTGNDAEDAPSSDSTNQINNAIENGNSNTDENFNPNNNICFNQSNNIDPITGNAVNTIAQNGNGTPIPEVTVTGKRKPKIR